MVNWTGRIAESEEAQQADAEARDLAGRLARSTGSVWLFTLSKGMGFEASEIIHSHLRTTMACAAAHALRGAFFDGVVRCRPR